MTPDATEWEIEVRRDLGQLMSFSKRDVFTQFDSLRSWSEASLPASRVQDAWGILRSHLRNTELTDPMLLAAAWLLRVRPNTVEQVERDTNRPANFSLQSKYWDDPQKAAGSVRRIAAACLLRNAGDLTGPVNLDRPFRWSGNGQTRELQEVSRSLMEAAEEWFEHESTPATRERYLSQPMPSESALAGDGDGVVPDVQPVRDPASDWDSELEEYAFAVARALDVSSPGYPTSLSPTALTPLLTLSPLRSHAADSSMSDTSLYGEHGTRGGAAARAALRSVDRAIVLGDPGGGKSTLLADALIDCVRSTGKSAVVWCRLADLASQLTSAHDLPESVPEILQLLADTGRVSLGIYIRPDVDLLVSALRGPNGGIIALDGLDEVPVSKRSLVETIIRRIEVVGTKIVVTSRHTGYRPFVQGWAEFSVDQLEPDAADDFLEAWFHKVADAEPMRRARTAIAESGESSIGRVPVLLGIVARVASSGDVPTNVGALYGRYLDLFLVQEWRGGAASADAGSLHRRLDVLQRLAWSMALSGDDSVTGSSWSDVATLSDLYESAGAGEQIALVDVIVSRDGVLVPHGAHLYRGAQSFRWIHRTLHEYLVGAHLAGLLRRDRPMWESHFEAILQGSLSWVEPTRFMIAILSMRPNAIEAVFDYGHRLRDLGDPGGVILDRLLSMSQALPADSVHRARIARAYVKVGNYSSAQVVHEPTWRAAYLAALHSPDTTEALTAVRQAVPVLHGITRAREDEVLDAIEATIEQIALAHTVSACSALEAFGEHRPDAQLLLYAKLLSLGMAWRLPPDYEHEKYTSSAVRAALRIIAAGSDNARSSLLHHVLFTGSPLPTGVEAPAWVDRDRAYRSLAATGDYGHLSEDTFRDVRETAVLAGHFGDHFAYQYGRMRRDGSYESPRHAEQVACVWAEVGGGLSDLFAHSSSRKTSAKVAWLSVDESSEAPSPDILELGDPDQIVGLVRLLLRWSADPRSAQLTPLVRLYMRLLSARSELEGHGLSRQPHDDATFLLVSCVEEVLGRHGTRALPEILSTNSEVWEGAPSEPLFRALVASGLDSQGLLDLVVWGLLGGIDILGECGFLPGSATEWLSLAAERGIRLHDLPLRGRQNLASWLARDGQLPRWRNELLRATQNDEPTDSK